MAGAERRLLGGARTRPRIPGAAQDPHEPRWPCTAPEGVRVMTSKPSTCVAIEPDLIAAATGEAVPSAAGRVDAHIAQCASCRNDYAHYRAGETVGGDLRTTMAPADAEDARRRLIERLSDLRSRLVHYRVAPSPRGPILIGVTEQGVALVEYLGRGGVPGSRLVR